MTFWLDGPTVKVKIKKTKVFSFTAPFYKEQFVKRIFFLLFLNLNILTIAVSYFLGHWQIRFLDQKTPLLRFLNFPKISVLYLIYRFLYSNTDCTTKSKIYRRKYQVIQAKFSPWIENAFPLVLCMNTLWSIIKGCEQNC